MDAASFTLGAFFARRYLPTFLVGASQRTIVEYSTSIEKWAALTRDPALCECTVEDLAAFKARLLEQPGRCTATLSRATANKHLRAVLAVLAKAGPPGPRNRDALGVIGAAPWVRLLRTLRRSPRSIPLETLGAIYEAADVATMPAGDVAAATWWRMAAAIPCTSPRRPLAARPARLRAGWPTLAWHTCRPQALVSVSAWAFSNDLRGSRAWRCRDPASRSGRQGVHH